MYNIRTALYNNLGKCESEEELNVVRTQAMDLYKAGILDSEDYFDILESLDQLYELF